MLPPDTRIPVLNSTEGLKIAGDKAPYNKDLADWLRDNPGKFPSNYESHLQLSIVWMWAIYDATFEVVFIS